MSNPLLRTARRQKGWSQQQLADFAGVSLSTIERAEKGESVRVDSIQRLCICLSKTPEEIGLLTFSQESSEILLATNREIISISANNLTLIEDISVLDLGMAEK